MCANFFRPQAYNFLSPLFFMSLTGRPILGLYTMSRVRLPSDCMTNSVVSWGDCEAMACAAFECQTSYRIPTEVEEAREIAETNANCINILGMCTIVIEEGKN